MQGDFAQLRQLYTGLGRAYATAALAVARQANQPALIARSLNGLLYPNMRLRRWSTVIDYGEETLVYYRATADPIMEAEALRCIGWCQLFCGQLTTGLAALQSAYAISSKLENQWG